MEEIRTVALHDGEELDDDLGGRTDEDLALAAALRVDNVVLPIQVSFKFEETHMMNVPGSRSCKNTRVRNVVMQQSYGYAQGQRRGPYGRMGGCRGEGRSVDRVSTKLLVRVSRKRESGRASTAVIRPVRRPRAFLLAIYSP